jgi:RimJ/RimL family protein N-acetyltransferase
VVEIVGEHLHLESLRPVDIPLMIHWSTKTRDSFFLRDSILPISSDDILLSLADTAQQIYKIVKDTTPLGLIKMYHLAPEAKRAHLSCTLGPSDNNKKLMQEACELLCNTLFTKQQLHKIYCQTLPYETDYKAILTSMRFQKEGTYKEHLFLNNTYYDLEIFGLTRERYYQ